MILTCPNCATDFFVDDHLIGADGRRVKCDECGEVWMAGGSAEAAPAEPAPFEPIPTPPPAAPPPRETPMFAPPRPPQPRPRPQPAGLPWRRLLILFLIALVLVGLYFAYARNATAISRAADSTYRAMGFTRTSPQIPHG